MDAGTIPAAFLVIGAICLFLGLVRRLPLADDDVAAVVGAILGTPGDAERPARADLEERSVAARPDQAARGRSVDAT